MSWFSWSKPKLPSGVVVKNISPQGVDPFHEEAGPVVKRYFKLHDMIIGALEKKDYRKVMKLAEEQLTLFPSVIAGMKEAARLNKHELVTIKPIGADAISNVFYTSGDWQAVIAHENRCRNMGIDTSSMDGRLAGSRRKLSKQ